MAKLAAASPLFAGAASAQGTPLVQASAAFAYAIAGAWSASGGGEELLPPQASARQRRTHRTSPRIRSSVGRDTLVRAGGPRSVQWCTWYLKRRIRRPLRRST